MVSDAITRAGKFLSHWLNSVDEHSLQAPFIYDFCTGVLKKKSSNAALQRVNQLRQSLLSDQTRIEVTDYGTGGSNSSRRSISSLARNSNQSRVSKLLYRICRKYQPDTILELGTNLGLSTLSMAAAVPQAEIITIEGCPAISCKAAEHFKTQGAQGVKIITGNLNEVLPQVLSGLVSIDLIFLDANHRYQPTMSYFKQCLSHCHPQTMVVIDDIYWSPEMTRAWKEIKEHSKVGMTVDLFYAGVVFFRENLSKTHHILHL